MKVAFICALYNYHQKPFAEAMSELCDFTFIEERYLSDERKELGHKEEERPKFLVHMKEERKKCEKIIDEADVLMFGTAPKVIVEKAKKDGKLLVKCTERIFKTPPKWYEMPLRRIRYFSRYRKMHLLCASAYTASDYAKAGAFKGRAYKWGYFPPVKEIEDLDGFITQKEKNSILWCGRIIDWKHPEMAVSLAKRLISDGYDFEIKIVGTGDMYNDLKNLIKEQNVESKVKLLGSMSPESVRELMEKSEIYIATSDRNEGWGVIVNEAMNSACALVASNEMGAVPYLVKDGENGFVYYNNNEEELYEKVKRLLDNSEERKHFSKKAYETIYEEWNGKIAAERLVNLFECLLNKKDVSNLYVNGPCSSADNKKRKNRSIK